MGFYCVTLQYNCDYQARDSSFTQTPLAGFIMVVRTTVANSSPFLSEGLITYFRTSSAIATFISSMANRVPMQLRGPAPNGRNESGWRLAFSWGVCLFNQKRRLSELI